MLITPNGEAYNKAYIIRLLREDPNNWYYYAIRHGDLMKIEGVVWTPYMSKAFPFQDEESVEEFKAHYISPRKVEILRINKEK